MIELWAVKKCLCCGKVLPDEYGGLVCSRCSFLPVPEEPLLYDFPCFSAALYEGTAETLVKRLKFGGDAEAARVMAQDMAGLAGKCGADVLTSVPLHHTRQRERGFNQSELIAEDISRIAGIPAAGLLVRNRATKQQSRLPHYKRRENVAGAFSPAVGASAAGKRILLIDDVITTGHTMKECMATLFAMGARSVCGLAFACPASKVAKANIK